MNISFAWDFVLNLCIVLGGIGAVVSMYGYLWPRVHARISAHVHEDYSAVCVSFECISRYLVLKSFSVPGYRIAHQVRNERGFAYGSGQLHCVEAPNEDSEYVDSFPIGARLYSKDSTGDFVFVVRETDLRKLAISLHISRWPFPIKYRLMT